MPGLRRQRRQPESNTRFVTLFAGNTVGIRCLDCPADARTPGIDRAIHGFPDLTFESDAARRHAPRSFHHAAERPQVPGQLHRHTPRRLVVTFRPVKRHAVKGTARPTGKTWIWHRRKPSRKSVTQEPCACTQAPASEHKRGGAAEVYRRNTGHFQRKEHLKSPDKPNQIGTARITQPSNTAPVALRFLTQCSA